MAVVDGGATDPASRLQRLLAAEDQQYQRAFLTAVRAIVDDLSLRRAIDLLEAGRVDEALDAVEAAADSFGLFYADSFNASATNTAAWLTAAALTIPIRFDVSNPRVVTLIRQNRFRLSSGFTNDTQRAVREALALEAARGSGVAQQARVLRETVGLAPSQVRQVENFRRLLAQGRAGGLPSRTVLDRALRDRRFDPTILRSIRDNQPLTNEQVERMVSRYRERLVASRARTIAQSEALRVVNEANDEMYRQAIDGGQIAAENLLRRWQTAEDERVRASHVSLNGVVRGINDVFPGFDGPLRFPGDPLAPAIETVNCRCSLSTRLDPLTG